MIKSHFAFTKLNPTFLNREIFSTSIKDENQRIPGFYQQNYRYCTPENKYKKPEISLTVFLPEDFNFLSI